MVRVFLDTNIYIDAVKRNKKSLEDIRGDLLFISALSTHILFYSFKLKVPDKEVDAVQNQFGILNLSEDILKNALIGPTPDLEDNIQLHSAAEAECDYFLTSDKKLLAMTYFGKTKIVDTLVPHTRG